MTECCYKLQPSVRNESFTDLNINGEREKTIEDFFKVLYGDKIEDGYISIRWSSLSRQKSS